jgi:hypothetical protein
MSNSGGSTSTTKTEPPDYVKPYSVGYLNQASNVANLPYQPYTGARIADFSPSQQLGFGMQTQNAINSAPLADQSNRSLNDTINGNYLNANSNPYLSGAVNQALGDVQSRVNSQFSGNNYGSTAHEQWLGQNLADRALPIYAQNYQNERGNQLNASMYAPGLVNGNVASMMQGGGQQQALNQSLNDLGFSEYQNALGFPYQQLNTMGGALGASSGYGSTTGPNPYQTNGLASALGGAASGGALGGMAAGASGGAIGGPMGMGVGAGLGLLAGLMR